MSATNYEPASLQTGNPTCVYCDTVMKQFMKETLSARHYSLFRCTDCGWEVAVPLAEDA